MEMISANIANADVSGYKSKDIDAKKMMSKEMSGMLTNTHNKHIGGLSMGIELHLPRTNQPVRERQYGEMNYEQAQFGHESTRYAATLQFLESRVGGIRRALRGE